MSDKLIDLIGSASKYLGKAVAAREMFYRGMEEAAGKLSRQGEGAEDRKYAFGKSQKGGQLINDNKWHMSQSRTFSLMAIAHGMFLMVQEQRKTNVLLKEVRDAVRRSPNR